MGCKKIPDLIELDTFDGDYFQYEEAVYASYKETFENHKFYMDGKPINHKKYPYPYYHQINPLMISLI